MSASTPDRVLVPLDGSAFAEQALPRALALASRWGAEVELVRVAIPVAGVSGSDAMVGDDSRERGRQMAEEYLKEVEERLRAAGFAGNVARTAMPTGNVANSILRRAAETEAGLVAMTTHGRGPVQRAWLGSTADSVIRAAACPVLLIRPRTEKEGEKEGDAVRPALDAPPPPPFRKAVVPLDGSREPEELLPLVGPLLEPDGTVVLLRAIPPFVAGGSPYLPHVVREEGEHGRVAEAAREYLEEVAQAPALEGRKAKCRVDTAAQPAVSILRAVEEEGADLVAMSTSGRGGVARLLLGSVADKVVRGATVPVLLHRREEDD